MIHDVSQELADTENALRDFISAELEALLGNDWLAQSGLTEEKIKKLHDRKIEEAKKLPASTIETRLIYYADVTDLETIILGKNWGKVFREIFDDKKKFEVFLNIILDYRNLEAHHRELFPDKKHLLIGACSQIRNMIVRYRSKKETAEDYFPRIECVRDNLGNSFTPGQDSRKILTLRVGDVLTFVVTATDPESRPLQYGASSIANTMPIFWQTDNNLQRVVTEEDIGLDCHIYIAIKSNRDHHAWGKCDGWDDRKMFHYKVLPKKVI